jgi:hypothetical protein
MKLSFAAVAALLIAGGVPQTQLYAQGPPPGQPYIQVPIPQIPVLPRSLGGPGLRSGALRAAQRQGT